MIAALASALAGSLMRLVTDSTSRSVASGLAREPEPALGDQVAHDLVGTARDRPGARVEERVLPTTVVPRERIALDHAAARAEQRERVRRDFEVELAEPHLADRCVPGHQR